MHRVPDTLQAWITAMNEAAKKISIPVINKFNSPLILTTITSINNLLQLRQYANFKCSLNKLEIINNSINN